jgi:hypothetical protein
VEVLNIIFAFNDGEGLKEWITEIPNISLYEGYFLFKVFDYDSETDILKFDKGKNLIYALPKKVDEEHSGGCGTTVEKKRIIVILNTGCGC